MESNISIIKVEMIIRHLEHELLKLEKDYSSNSRLLDCTEEEMKRIQKEITYVKSVRECMLRLDHNNKNFTAVGSVGITTLSLKNMGYQKKLFHLTASLSTKIDEKVAIERLLVNLRAQKMKIFQQKTMLSRLLNKIQKNFLNTQIKAEEKTIEELVRKLSAQ